MKPQQTGFTLLELIITLTAITVVVALALPSFQNSLNRNRLATKSNDIVTAINLARNEAITRSQIAGVCPSNDGIACANGAWGQGWIVWTDDNGNNAFDANEAVRVNNLASSANPAEQVQVVATAAIDNGITFTPLGFVIEAGGGTLTINDLSGTAGQQSIIQIGTSGRVHRAKVDI
ncbi:MAG: GspH/FimT family pseudopilin [Xanthomonadales bacterium]|jgi:type IV fimbrial biogenesis protein FimT|nr:GspH/FimT family pseudopilin [Xanthomonadales bacterium]